MLWLFLIMIILIITIVMVSVIMIKVFIIRPEFWSVDPYARIYPISFGYKMPMTMLGSQVIMMTMMLDCYNSHESNCDKHDHDNGQVSKVLESRNPKFPPGSHVLAYTGWRELAVVPHHHCHCHHCHH